MGFGKKRIGKAGPATGKKTFKLPHVYVLLLIVMLFVLLLTYIVPSGEYARIADPETGRSLLDPSSFTIIEKTYLGIMDFFTAIHQGAAGSVDVIFMVLFIAATVNLVEETGAINAGVHAVVRKLHGKDTLLIVMLTCLFSFLGAIGLAEGASPLLVLAVTLSVALGYDRATGAGAAILGLCVGFTSGPISAFTTGIGQTIVGLPLYSGIGYRLFILVVCTIVAAVYAVSYAKKIKKNPEKSVSREYRESRTNALTKEGEQEAMKLTWQRKLILAAMLITFGFQLVGSLKFGWALKEFSALYIMLALFSGLIYGMKPSELAVQFAVGAGKILPAALTIGIAGGVMVLMQNGKILDTAIYGLANLLDGKSPVIVLILVYLAVVIFNFFVTSGSGKAVMLIPLLGPLGQLVNINQQVMIVGYQLGDGFTNYLFPTSGGLMASLAFAGLTYEEWFKYSFKIFAILIPLGAILTCLAHFINLGPF